MFPLPSGVRFVIYILRSANLPRPTVPRKTTAMNYLQLILTVGGLVVKESSSRSRVTWYKSQSRQLIPEGYTSSIPKALKFLIMYRIVVIDTFLGVGLQKVYCQFRYLLSSFFLLDRFISNFGNLRKKELRKKNEKTKFVCNLLRASNLRCVVHSLIR
jgi:hypothetical protein